MTAANPFSPPATATGITWADHLGKLILAEPSSIEELNTDFGEKTAVRATVSVITGPGEADVYEDCLIFPSVLVSQLRTKLGEKVLGRLGQGEAKKGQNPPWKLIEADDDDIAKGVAYLEARGRTTVTGPDDDPPAGAEVPF